MTSHTNEYVDSRNWLDRWLKLEDMKLGEFGSIEVDIEDSGEQGKGWTWSKYIVFIYDILKY